VVILTASRLKAFGVEDSKLAHGILPVFGRSSTILRKACKISLVALSSFGMMLSIALAMQITRSQALCQMQRTACLWCHLPTLGGGRSFAWIEKCRHLWKNYERKLNTRLQFFHLVFLALTQKVVNRL